MSVDSGGDPLPLLGDQHTSIDYRRPGVWEELAAQLERSFEPRPQGSSGRVECEPGWSWRPHLPDYDLWLAVNGSGQMRLGDQIYDIRRGTLMVLRPGDQGWAVQDPNDRLTVVYVHFDFFVPGSATPVRPDAGWLPARYLRLHDTARLDRLLTSVVSLLEQNQRLAYLEAQLVLKQALIEIYRQDALQQGVAAPQLDPRIARVIAHLRSHPWERLSLERAATIACLSPGYFSRLFERTTGVSFRAYAVRARLDRAHVLLGETAMSIGAIAQALGYDDVFLFSRQFKRYFGYPPSQVRKQAFL